MRPENCGILDFYEQKCKVCDYGHKCAIKLTIEHGKEIKILSGMVGLNTACRLQTLLKAKYPNLEVDLDFEGAHECLRMLHPDWGEADFAIVGDISGIQPDQFNIKEVGKDWLVLVTPPDHPLAEKKEVTLDDVLKYPLISLSEDYGIATSVIRALKESGYENVEPSMVVGDFLLQLNSISNNLGIGITSMIASLNAYESGMVKMRLIKDLKDARSVYLISAFLPSESESMKEYFDFMAENLEKMFEEFHQKYSSLK